MEALKKLLYEECKYHLPEELMDEFLSELVEVKLKSGERLIRYGQFNDNVYVMKSGIIRYCYFDGEKEKTFGFVVPGNVMIQYHCYYANLPSFFQPEACGDSVVMKISKEKMDALLARSHEFSTWLLTLSMEQLYTNERKLLIINGHAENRFRALVENRPEILSLVPLKVIASYLGITPQYLSQLRKAYFEKR